LGIHFEKPPGWGRLHLGFPASPKPKYIPKRQAMIVPRDSPQLATEKKITSDIF
jgi:hypothetical protein